MAHSEKRNREWRLDEIMKTIEDYRRKSSEATNRYVANMQEAGYVWMRIWLPEELKRRVENEKTQSGRTFSAIMQDALEKYYKT